MLSPPTPTEDQVARAILEARPIWVASLFGTRRRPNARSSVIISQPNPAPLRRRCRARGGPPRAARLAIMHMLS